MMINNKQVVTRNGVTDMRNLDGLILDMWQRGWQGWHHWARPCPSVVGNHVV